MEHTVALPQDGRALARRMDAEGVVCLENAASPAWLDAVRNSVTDSIARHGDSDFHLSVPDEDTDSPVHDLLGSPEVQTLFRDLTDAAWPRANRADDRIRHVFRVLTGTTRAETPMLFHYDAYAVTMLVPIFIPESADGQSGELIALRNHRPFRRTLTAHVVDKLRTQNRFFRKRVLRRVRTEPDRYVVDLKPGNVYLFWGYRTFHGNLPCAPGLLRTTLIVNFGEPHPHSPALAAARALSRGRREARRMREPVGVPV